MIPWKLLDKTSIPGNSKELYLYQRDLEYSIKVGASELMNSRVHNSEDALASLSCRKIKNQMKQKVLIGGLGMGFTLRVALNNLKLKAQITVAELLPEVVEWNRSVIGHLAGHPLKDKRVTVYQGDVAEKINNAQGFYHAILLDVDNGAQGMTQQNNDSLYNLKGLQSAYEALTPGGVLAVWSAGIDNAFKRLLQKFKFKVEEIKVRTRSGAKEGGHSVIWIAVK